MTTKDRIAEAAQLIYDEIRLPSLGNGTARRPSKERIIAIIEEHMPFASTPVPRCETCARWSAGQAFRFGECSLFLNMLSGKTIVTPANFGCVQWKSKT